LQLQCDWLQNCFGKSWCVTHRVTVILTAELQWEFLEVVYSSAPEECKALLLGDGRNGPITRPTRLLCAALESVAAQLRYAAAEEIYVSWQDIEELPNLFGAGM
jgi:hypothetical protein